MPAGAMMSIADEPVAAGDVANVLIATVARIVPTFDALRAANVGSAAVRVDADPTLDVLRASDVRAGGVAASDSDVGDALSYDDGPMTQRLSKTRSLYHGNARSARWRFGIGLCTVDLSGTVATSGFRHEPKAPLAQAGNRHTDALSGRAESCFGAEFPPIGGAMTSERLNGPTCTESVIEIHRIRGAETENADGFPRT